MIIRNISLTKSSVGVKVNSLVLTAMKEWCLKKDITLWQLAERGIVFFDKFNRDEQKEIIDRLQMKVHVPVGYSQSLRKQLTIRVRTHKIAKLIGIHTDTGLAVTLETAVIYYLKQTDKEFNFEPLDLENFKYEFTIDI